MKKQILFVIISAFLISLIGCSKSETHNNLAEVSSKKINISDNIYGKYRRIEGVMSETITLNPDFSWYCLDNTSRSTIYEDTISNVIANGYFELKDEDIYLYYSSGKLNSSFIIKDNKIVAAENNGAKWEKINE
ncbi:hypothetical protein [Clostridium grantii]|uniref:Lipoprotein n=1 Tax=Clostridium grantii DSM 8605 TaxID=1121316 RepID=A0A1M5WWN0_9CLOT|nr:hypothetical protein [Clostridium grantii]SHH91901.1 hypothetical protein SAMN02745207_03170 [Clostridium grantii DSM 8605]